MREVFKCPETYVTLLRPAVDDDTQTIDSSWQAAWPTSALRLLDAIEASCFSMSGEHDHMCRMALKNSKTAEDMFREYHPFKDWVSLIDEAIQEECQAILDKKKALGATTKSVVDDDDSAADDSASAAVTAAEQTSAVAFFDETRLDPEALKLAHARRVMASFLVLEVEEKVSQSQLAEALGRHALVKLKGSGETGNIMIIFDVNGFGETITAPHIRRPPVTQETLKKLYRSLNTARHGVADLPAGTPVPLGEVHIVVDGGRTNNGTFSKLFGAGPGVKKVKALPGQPRTLCRQTMLTFTEQSVRGRRARLAKGMSQPLNCRQGMLCWYNSGTYMPQRPHKHYPESTNTSNVYGPIMLESWRELPALTVAEKRAWWSKRRVACGGRTVTGAESEDGAEEDDDELEPEACQLLLYWSGDSALCLI